MIDKRIVGVCHVAIPIDKSVIPHIAIAESAWIREWTSRALKLDLFPTAIEKSLIVRIVRVAADKIRARATTIAPDDLRQSRLEKKRSIWRSKIVQIQQRVDVLLGNMLGPSMLRRDDFCLCYRLEYMLGNLTSPPSLISRTRATKDGTRDQGRSCLTLVSNCGLT